MRLETAQEYELRTMPEAFGVASPQGDILLTAKRNHWQEFIESIGAEKAAQMEAEWQEWLHNNKQYDNE